MQRADARSLLSFQVRSESGDVLDFVPAAVRPLSFEDLLNSEQSKCGTYEIEFLAEDPVLNGNVQAGGGRIKATASFNEPLTVFAIVDNGWLPPPLVIPPWLLVDRNVVSTLAQLRNGAQRRDFDAFSWWFQSFKDAPALFNPLPYAFEGGFQSQPTLEEFAHSFSAATAEILSSLPGSKVVTLDERGQRAAYEILEQFSRRLAVEAAFLRAVVPLVVDRKSTSDLPRAAREIAEAARLHGVSTRSLVGLTVLSCLYEDLQGNGYPIGRKILKPKRDYGAKAAYNAISDLRHLELLIASRLIAPTSTWSLCTCDKALALLWCAASPHDAKLVDGELNFSIVFDERNFPRATTPDLKRLATHE